MIEHPVVTLNSNDAMSENQRVLAFLGSDLKEKGPEFLQQVYSESYSLLALDVPAIGLAAAAKVPYSLIDDWVDSESTFRAREKAAECERKWYEAARDEFTSDEICWPELDREAMYWFWHDITSAGALAEAFVASGVQDLAFFQNAVRRPAIYYYPSDIISAFWKSELLDKANLFKVGQKSFWKQALWDSFSKLCSKVSSRKRVQSDLPITYPSSITGKVVLAFNHGEFNRFTPIVRQLLKGLRGNVAAIILSANQVVANEIAAKWSIPVVCGPSSASIDPHLQKKFLRGYVKALDAASGQPWQKPLESLRFHFEYYCKRRWPMLAAVFRSWSDLWSQARPKAVLVSSLQDGESQLPTEAARRLGIPTLSIPHGAVMPRSWDLVVSDYILYGLSTQRTDFERSGIPAHRLIACCDVVAENEYSVDSINTFPTEPSWRLLVLTKPIGFPGCMAPSISPTAQLVALRTLNNPPPDIAKQLSLRVKVHPNRRLSDLELFAVIGHEIAEHVLPLNSELWSVLEQTDVVVAANYSGSALVHTLRAGKAVIFFWTDPLIGKAEPRAHADLFLPAGTLVRNPVKFWSVVRGFFTNRELAKKMQLKAQQFCRDNLDDSNYPNIGNVVDDIVSKQMDV